MSKKWFQRVPKWTPKVDKNRQKGCSGGVPKRDLKKVPSPGPGKVRFCCYLLHFSKVGGLKKVTFLGTILGPFGRQNRWNRVSDRGRKKVVKIYFQIWWFWGQFWGSLLSKKSVVCRSKMSLTYGPLKIVILGPSGHPKSTKFEVIFWCKFDRFGRWLGRAVHKHQCSFSSVVHVILAAEQSKADTAQQSTAQQIRIQHITRTA